MKVKRKPKTTRALVWGEPDHAKMMDLTGLDARCVIRSDKGLKWAMRPGETLGLFDLRAFGPVRDNWEVGVRAVTEQGASIVEIRGDGSHGVICKDAAGAALVVLTLRRKEGEAKMPKGKAARMARQRVNVIIENRMPSAEAGAIWTNKRKYSHVRDALAKMTGWSMASAYRVFGVRDTPSGRKPAKS